MGATRPHNPAARGELLGATAPWRNRSQTKKNKPTLNTKLRILPALRAKTRRTDGRSIKAICEDLNGLLQGWFAYFKHSHWTTFLGLDGWIRMRLRSILRWRRKGKGRGRGADHQRWPNAFFVRHGLFTMQTARLHAVRALAVQSR